MKNISFNNCLNILNNNNIIIYPTESMFSLGCNPDSDSAIVKLLKLKNRSQNKGLILIASSYEQLQPYINEDKLSYYNKKKMLSLWPGFITFLVPAHSTVSNLITGYSDYLAVRITKHPIVRKLCNDFGKPIISTSANISGMQASRTTQEIFKYFGYNIPILIGTIGKYLHPSKIVNIITGEYIRNV